MIWVTGRSPVSQGFCSFLVVISNETSIIELTLMDKQSIKFHPVFSELHLS